MQLFDNIEEDIFVFRVIDADQFEKNEENNNKCDRDEPVDEQRKPERSDEKNNQYYSLSDLTEMEVLLNHQVAGSDELEDQNQQT